MNNEWIRNWKEAVMSCFKVLFLHFPGETKA